MVPEVVTFRWRDSAHHNEQKLLTLVLDKFLCRFLLHILPQGFRRIRNFGFFGQPQTRHTPTPLLSVFGIGTTAASRTARFRHRRSPRFLALPQVWWSDESRRAAHCCRNPTPFSTAGHHSSMKQLSPTRFFRVSRHAPYSCALPSNKSLTSASSTTPFDLLFRGNQLFDLTRQVFYAAAKSRQALTPLLPTIEFP